MAKRRQAKQDARARVESMRAEQRAKERRQRFIWFGAGGVIAAGLVVALVVALATRGGGGKGAGHEVMPPGVGGGTPVVQPAALVVPNTTGIKGVVAYDTTGWPQGSNNGPSKQALPHTHVTGPVAYSVTPPVGGDHNATWMNCGVYNKPVPVERAVHNLEHGAIWITYRPSLPSSEVSQLIAFFSHQTVLAGGARYVDVTPFPGLPTPIVASALGFQLRLQSPTDPRLQQFVDTFRYSQKFSPEYQGPCTGGVGTPLQH